LNHQLHNIYTELRNFDRVIHGQLASGDKHQKEAVNTFKHFTDQLTSDLKMLEDKLIKNLRTKKAMKHLKEEFHSGFDQFKNKSLESGSQEVVTKLSKAEEWLDKLDTEFEDYREHIEIDSNTTLKLKIMIVDDDDIYRLVIEEMLEKEKMEPISLSNGKSAINHLQQDRPDLVLLDYKMPGIDGIATLKQIRATPLTQDIPVIMLTGNSSREMVAQSMQAGANDFIAKPSDRVTILSKIHEVLGNS